MPRLFLCRASSSSRLVATVWILATVLGCWDSVVQASIVSSSDARLPMSLSMIISDLEVEGCSELIAACFITSKSVSTTQQRHMLEQLVGDLDDNSSLGTTSVKAVGTSSGLALCVPDAPSEAALTACACGGTIVYYADPTDLSRGEGLFDRLAPAMEKLVAKQNMGKSTLVVIHDENQLELTKKVLEREGESVVAQLISDRPLSVLQDIFDVKYVPLSQVPVELLSSERAKTNPVDAAARVAETVDLETMFAFSSVATGAAAAVGTSAISAQDLAAARKLGPLARIQVSQTVTNLQHTCTDTESGGESRLVEDFGAVCHLATQQALQNLYTAAGDTPFWNAKMAQQIRSTLLDELDVELDQLRDIQLNLLQQQCYDEFRKSVSKLLVGPNLSKDMTAVAAQAVQKFTQAARKLVAKQPSWTYLPAKRRFESRVKEFVTNRLETAQANGQYRPLPRKGMTLGLHWLLPKPFGNDFRQEPWMVHAADGLTYVPSDKISDVNPTEVQAGDWRNKIVPSPAGNDMVYLQ